MGQSGRSIQIRIKEHNRHIRLAQPDKSEVAEHSIKHGHTIKLGLPRQAEVAQGVPDRLRPRIFLTFQHYKVGRSSAKRTGRRYSRRIPWYSLSEAESTSGHMVLSGVPRKKSQVTQP